MLCCSEDSVRQIFCAIGKTAGATVKTALTKAGVSVCAATQIGHGLEFEEDSSYVLWKCEASTVTEMETTTRQTSARILSAFVWRFLSITHNAKLYLSCFP